MVSSAGQRRLLGLPLLYAALVVLFVGYHVLSGTLHSASVHGRLLFIWALFSGLDGVG